MAERNKRGKPWRKYVEAYEAGIRESCSYRCNCCGRLCYKKNLRNLKRWTLEEKGCSLSFLDHVFAIEKPGLQKFCTTCHSDISKNKIPKLCLNNGLDFPIVDPRILELNRIEERLVAPCHVFQTIWSVMGPTGQLRGKGGIVNVPVNLDTTVSSLPRLSTNSNIYHVRLARRQEYQSNYMSGVMDLVKVYDVARCLVQKPLFMEHGIELTENWEVHPDIDCDSMSEFDFEMAQETMLSPEEGIRLAPAEGYQPKSILLDPDAEYLAFPKIYGGYRLNPLYNGKPIPYSDVSKSILMRYDRRAAERGDYILFMAKKRELLKLNSNIGICLRKKSQRSNEPIRAANMLDSSYVQGLVQHDDGYHVLRGVRNSNTHWKGEGNKILAMMRQFGLPTFFLTLSAADTRWAELIVQLKKNVDKIRISEEDAERLGSDEKAKLVQLDPATCVLHFEKRYSELKKTWSAEDGPFRGIPITHSYRRVEFQQRGSPHNHMLLWLEDVPLYDHTDPASGWKVCSFIDTIITCSSKNISEELISLQTHKHTRTCQRKNGKPGCRFGIPYFPMHRTVILEPYSEGELSATEKQSLQDHYDTIKTFQLQEEATQLTLKEFLQRLKLSEKDYVRVIRFSLRKSHIFMRRRPCEMNINPYNPYILKLMRSNMDLQYILDAYGCAAYVVNYINKTDRGMSELMQTMLEKVRGGDCSVKDTLKAITNTFYNNSELSIQEACYNILQLPLSESSDQCVFIPTFPPNERVRLIRSNDELLGLDPSSTDIFTKGLLDHYSKRPLSLEALTLAEFAAYYNFSRKPSKNALPLIDNDGFVVKTTKPKVIRYRSYSFETHPDDYYREMVMLFHPWRDEKADILERDNEEMFCVHKDSISRIKCFFHSIDDNVISMAFHEANTQVDLEDSPEFDVNRPIFDFDNYHLNDPDNITSVCDDSNESSKTFDSVFVSPGLLKEKGFISLLEKLNVDQRDYVAHLGEHFRSSDSPIYHFITGGAGTGKSLLISAIYQVVKRVFNTDNEGNPDIESLLLCAPTGKAAYNIKGQTIHTAFKLPLNQKRLNFLSPDVSNTMATLYANVKLLIIDECSMVGQTVFAMVDKRLQQIFNNDRPFGGISVILVGDLFQLKPVFSTPLYYPLVTDPYEEIFGLNLWHKFQVFRLTKIMRQSNIDFQTALNNMAVGQMSESDVKLLRSRLYSSVPNDIALKDAIHLFATNEKVDEFNSETVRTIPGPLVPCNASDVIGGTGSAAAMRQIMYSACNSRSSDTMGLPTTVLLKVSAKYMLTYNVDTSDGLSNGVCGRLERIDYGTNTAGEKKPLRVWISFDDPTIGRKKRRVLKTTMSNLSLPPTWTPVEPVVVRIKTRMNSNLHVNRKQFPLCLAHAITIHKSQGMSLNTVVVHITSRMTRSLLYVACSRATTLNGLYLIGVFNPPAPMLNNDHLWTEMARWEICKVSPCFRFLRQSQCDLQILYHNVQSLRKKWGLVTNDSSYKKSHVLFFSETWASPDDSFNFPRFKVVQRIGDSRKRRPRGIWLFAHEIIHPLIVDSGKKVFYGRRGMLEVCWIKISKAIFIGIYASPRTEKSVFLDFLRFVRTFKSRRTVILGDFNMSSSVPSLVLERAKLDHFALLNAGEPTTLARSSLDWILSNHPVEYGKYISFTSFHDPIFVRFPFERL